MGTLRIVANSYEGANGKRMRVRGQDVRVVLTRDDGTVVDLTSELAIKRAKWTVEVDSRGSYASACLEIDGVEVEADVDERDLSHAVRLDDEGSGPSPDAIAKLVEAGVAELSRRWEVKCDETNNTPEDMAEGRVNVGVTMSAPMHDALFPRCPSCSFDGARLVAACSRHAAPR